MANGGSQEPSSADGLQFDHAEYAATAPASVTCRSCGQPIAEVYYELQGQTLCAACAGGASAWFAGGSKAGRFFKAAGFGTAAAAGAAVIIYLFESITGWQAPIVAILAGYMVGSAVRQGTGYRGGRVYQVLAVFLTYSAVAWSNVPDIYKQFSARADAAVAAPGGKNGPAVAAVPPAREGGDARADADAFSAEAKQAPAAEKPAAPAARPPQAFHITLALVALVVAYLAPILGPLMALPQGLIGLVIVFFGLQQAWRLTRKVALDVRGPFRVGQGGPPLPGVPADG